MRHDEIRDFMQEKSTDELLTIWKENDGDRYSNAAFLAIESILRERGQTIEDQNCRPSPVPGKRCIGRLSFFLIALAIAFVHARWVDAGFARLDDGSFASGDSPYYYLFIIFTMLVLEVIVWFWAVIMRLNDLNLSRQYLGLLVVPGVNLFMLVVLFLFSGAPAEDEEDDDPQEGGVSKGTK
ncbi:MAG: hypothetical protein U9Q07_06970 [Planctomycetota bacterium]|nr:hypothetical protein [Planctomycetota bacterium]